MPTQQWDVVVVGAGNAAFCAALSAREQGARVVVLERAPEDERGGNTRFTAGAIRCAYRGVEDLKAIMPDLTEEEIAQTDFGTYTEDQFFDDMVRVTQYRTDPELVRASWCTRSLRHHELAARQGRPLPADLRPPGLQGRRQVQVLGRPDGRGCGRRPRPGRCRARHRREARASTSSTARARDLAACYDGRAVTASRVKHRRRNRRDHAPARWCSPPAASRPTPRWRTRYLGPGWDLAKVRGTRFNTGDGIRMALDIGAAPCGNWSGCHAVGWDRNAPEFGDLAVGDGFQKHSYPFGIMVNADGPALRRRGRRFPQLHLRQVRPRDPGAAGPVRVAGLRRQGAAPAARRIPHPQVTKVQRRHPRGAGREARRRRRGAFLDEIRALQRRRPTDVPFNPNVKDGRCDARARDAEDRTGPTRSTRRPSRPTRRPAASPSPSAACASTPTAQVLDARPGAHPRPLRGRRTGRRAVLLQLSGRHRPHVRRGVRTQRRCGSGRLAAALAWRDLPSMRSGSAFATGGAGVSFRPGKHGDNLAGYP